MFSKAQASDQLLEKPGYDSVAEWSKALRSGRSPKGRGFEPHRCHIRELDGFIPSLYSIPTTLLVQVTVV